MFVGLNARGPNTVVAPSPVYVLEPTEAIVIEFACPKAALA